LFEKRDKKLYPKKKQQKIATNNSNNSKIKFKEYQNVLEIIIPVKKDWVQIISGFILCFIAFYMMFLPVVLGPIFLLFTIGCFFMLVVGFNNLLWYIFGKEIIVVSNNKIILNKRGLLHYKAKQYNLIETNEFKFDNSELYLITNKKKKYKN